MSHIKQKIIIRKAIAQFKKALRDADQDNRYDIIKAITYNENLLKKIISSEMGVELPGAPGQIYVEPTPKELPTLGKLKMIIEKDLNNEQQRLANDPNQSDVDIKRLALKSVFFDYYNELDYPHDTIIVDYESDMTLRRDDQEVDNTDFDLAPNKNKIYRKWIEKLNRYVREGRLKEQEYDEAIERGIPQGGAFEKQLDRYRKEIMQQLWQDYYQQRKDQWKTQ
jgi:hypothetical protein